MCGLRRRPGPGLPSPRPAAAAEYDRSFREHASEGAPDVAADPAGEGSPPCRAGPDWGGP